MKEVVIVKIDRNTEPKIEFLSSQLISFTQQLHTLQSWIKRYKKRYKRSRTDAIIEAYNDVKKDIQLIRRALAGKFNIIIVRDFTNLEEVNEE